MTKSTKDQKAPITYAKAGVDIDAGNALVDAIKPAVKSTQRAGTLSELGGFGGLFDLKAVGYNDPILVAATDGVGTKLKIAIETGQHATIGIDLVAMCVNDLIVQGAEPLFFLDYFATGKLDPDQAQVIIAGIAEGCRQAGCALIGGETAEMPGMYAGNDYDLAGFSVGAVERSELLPRTDIAAGNQLIALPSSGIHSNGYSLVRKLVTDEGLNWTDNAPWQNTDSSSNNLDDGLLIPTKIYVKPILNVLTKTKDKRPIKAIAHITGGGLTENIPRVLPGGLSAQINLDRWQPPPVFGWLARQGKLDDQEMLRTFNCGIGLVLVVRQADAKHVCEALKTEGETPIVIGEIRSTDDGAEGQPTVAYESQLKLHL